jgi:hypothetical protein
MIVLGRRKTDFEIQERDELERDDAEVARGLQEEEDFLTEDSVVNMTVYMFDNARTIHFQSYELSRVHGGMEFCLSEQETSNVLSVVESTQSDGVRFTIHSRTAGGVPLELANSPVVDATNLVEGTTDLVFETDSTSMAF